MLVVVGGFAVLAAVVVVAVFALRSSPAPAPAPPRVLPATSRAANSGFPAPPKGAVLYARQLGDEALALGVVPGRGGVLAQASVLGGQGKGVSGLTVTLNGKRAQSCGSGCYRVRLAGRPRSVTVHVRKTNWNVDLPTPWPPRDGTAIVDQATAAWRGLNSLSFEERLASSARHATRSTWRVEAPGKVAYRIPGGPEGIVIGERRWDRDTPKGNWIESRQTRLTQPVAAWTAAQDAHVLGAGVLRGRPVWKVSFFDPGTPAWFTVAIDKKTYHTLETDMIATAHFMHDVYGAFNATPAIKPPS